jgi:hypothetical protein
MNSPFIVLPRYILNTDGQGAHVEGRVRPDEVADYYQGINEGTVVVLKSGSCYLLGMEINDFDRVLQAYYRYIQGKKDLPVLLHPDFLLKH